MKMKLIFTLSLIFAVLTANANTFTVTSNTDSGPGSLREAITLANANGTAITDNIIFNIADLSINGRTITLLTSYPDLTSKIVIDGTTQPGMDIGISNAKIRITNPIGIGVEFVFRIIGQADIEIYGLHFNAINGINGSAPSAIAIQLHNSSNIKVGAAGKGNYFTKLAAGVANTFLPYPGKGLNNGLSFKGNIVNLSEDGNSIVTGSFATAINLQNVKDLEVGGELPGEGNYMCSITDGMVYVNTDTFSNINLGYARIINNKMGCNYTETAGLTCGYIYLQNLESFGYTDTTNILVKGNSFNAFAYAFSNNLKSFIKIEGKKGYLEIKNNRIGLLGNPAVNFFSIISGAISVSRCDNGVIGGDNAGDTNFIAGCVYTAISLNNNKNIRVTKNSIFCNGNGIFAASNLVSVPLTKIFTITGNMVQGTSMPNSTVEIFLTQICAYCDNGKTYLGNCLADASGSWTFNSPVVLNGSVTATGTSVQGVTGEFAKPKFTQSNFTTRNPTCSQNNGFIHGMQFVSGTRYYWAHSYNGNFDTLYTENIDNVGPGNYKFVVEQGSYCSVNFSVNLIDNSPRLYFQNVAITQPSCGLNSGKILSHSASGSYNKIIWKDAANNTVGNNSLDLINVGPGQYKLIILDTTYGCGDSSNFYTLTNQAGPFLNTGNVQITAARCSNNNGSILGITASNVSGVPFIMWVDSLNNPVGNAMDLANVFPGKYRLKFKDASSCDTIVTQYYTITNEGIITINTNGIVITGSDCGAASGSIMQIQVAGATVFQWINAAGSIVGTNISLTAVPAGKYILKTSNAFGCIAQTDSITVPLLPFIPNLGNLQFISQSGKCDRKDGYYIVGNFPNPQLYSFYWVDSLQPATLLSTGLTLTGINSGTYFLFARNAAGCEEKFFTARIPYQKPVKLDATGVQINSSTCNLNNGTINGLASIIGSGLTPFTYAWYNNSQVVVANQQQLANVVAGNYTFVITDANGCADTSSSFAITNTNISIPRPVYLNQNVRIGTTVTLTVKNPQPGTYYLYGAPTSTIALSQNNTGIFTGINILKDITYYIAFASGSCISERTAVEIKAFSVTEVFIPNAFTPNNDNKNDLLRPLIIGLAELDYFIVYNKYGEIVYSTKDAAAGWDGTFKGKLQSGGTYVWIFKGRDKFNGRPINEQGSFILIR